MDFDEWVRAKYLEVKRKESVQNAWISDLTNFIKFCPICGEMLRAPEFPANVRQCMVHGLIYLNKFSHDPRSNQVRLDLSVTVDLRTVL